MRYSNCTRTGPVRVPIRHCQLRRNRKATSRTRYHSGAAKSSADSAKYGSYPSFELNQRRIPNPGASPKLPAKPRKANRILATQNVQTTYRHLYGNVKRKVSEIRSED